jgi:hypothetical protein
MKDEPISQDILVSMNKQMQGHAAKLKQQTALLLDLNAKVSRQSTMLAYIIQLVTTGNEGAGKTATSQPPNLGKLSTELANEVIGSNTSFTTFSFQLP